MLCYFASILVTFCRWNTRHIVLLIGRLTSFQKDPNCCNPTQDVFYCSSLSNPGAYITHDATWQPAVWCGIWVCCATTGDAASRCSRRAEVMEVSSRTTNDLNVVFNNAAALCQSCRQTEMLKRWSFPKGLVFMRKLNRHKNLKTTSLQKQTQSYLVVNQI